jgi:dTDP-4-amino-4,6-dideoxygalactose transaminase
LTDVQSALGTSQMNRIEEFIKRRRDIVNKYNNAFKNIKEVVTPYQAEFSYSGWHIYVIKIRPELLTGTRKEIFEALQAENIGVNVHYLPVYLHPYYKALGYEKGICPNAEDLYENMITLPLFPSMTEKDVEDVIDAVNKVVDHYRK